MPKKASSSAKAGQVKLDVPVVLDRQQPLVWYAFDAEGCEAADLDRLLAQFLERLLPAKRSLKRPLQIWRGEMENEAGRFRILAISKAPARVYEMLLAVVGDYHCDYGERSAAELGAQPGLLLAPEGLYAFDANQPPGKKGRLRLGEQAFDVRYLPFIWRAAPPKRSGPPLPEKYAKLVEDLASWRGHLTSSPLENLSFVRQRYPDLLAANNGQFDYPLLKLFCERALCLEVTELPMKELGRIVVWPIWEEAEGGFANVGFTIRLAVQPTTNKPAQLAALAHELGHYIFHLHFHIFFARLPFAVMQNADVEQAAAQRLAAVRAEYYHATELRADFLASAFLVPLGYGEWYNDNFITGKETAAATIETLRLHHALNAKAGPLSEAQEEFLLRQSDADRAAREARSYDTSSTLLERVGWCVAHREDAKAINRLAEAEDRLTELLSALIGIVSAPDSAPHLAKTEADLYRRVTLEEVETFACATDAWDPVIVEPRGKERATGYRGIKLAFAPKAHNRGPTDWVRHPSAGDASHFCGTAADWLEKAEARGEGLMVFPLDPMERWLRGSSASGKLLRELQRNLERHEDNN